MWITISNIADKFRLKIKRLFYAQGPEVLPYCNFFLLKVIIDPIAAQGIKF